VVTTVSLFAVIAYIWATWDYTFTKLVGMFDQVAVLVYGDLRTNTMVALDVAYRDSVAILLPILVVTILAAIAANYFQFGSIFAFEAVMPKLEKINPASGVKRIFSMKQIIETLKSILKIVFLSVLLYFVIREAIVNYVGSLACG